MAPPPVGGRADVRALSTAPNPSRSDRTLRLMTLFDVYLFIDWSARNVLSPASPSSDSIWVGELAPPAEPSETYCRSREEATFHVRGRLADHVDHGRRVLVGFDFPYGYPAGLAAGLGLDGREPWRAIWDLLGDELTDDAKNKSNRFAVAHLLNGRMGEGPGPFWGCPAAATTNCLTSTMKGLFEFPFATALGQLRRLRLTEKAIGGVQETWKLAGAGSVGSQALVGIPRVRALRDDSSLAEVSTVWPFETGFTASPAPDRGPFVLHAEIWPGIIKPADLAAEKATTNVIHDQAQVRLMCRWAFIRDQQGSLGPWFDSTKLSEGELRAAVNEEGWILGCQA